MKDEKLSGNRVEFIRKGMPWQGSENRTLKIQNWRSNAMSYKNNLKKIDEIQVTDQVGADIKYKALHG